MDASRTGSGFYADNWELSSERALTVLRLLAASGVNPSNLSAVGRGASMPVASNATEAGRAKNRRVEIVVMSRPDRTPGSGGVDAGVIPSVIPSINPEVTP